MQWKDVALGLHRCLTPDSHRLFEKRMGQEPRSKYHDTASKFAFIAEYQIYPVLTRKPQSATRALAARRRGKSGYGRTAAAPIDLNRRRNPGEYATAGLAIGVVCCWGGLG